MPNRASYALHSVSKGSANKNAGSKKDSHNKNSHSKSSSSNPLSNSTLTNNTSTTWDGSQALNVKSSQVQIHGRRRRGSTSTGSGESDEVPLGKDLGSGGLNGGIERKIEFSVEESADARTGSAGNGNSTEVGWGRDLERDGASSVGEGREIKAGRAF